MQETKKCFFRQMVYDCEDNEEEDVTARGKQAGQKVQGNMGLKVFIDEYNSSRTLMIILVS